MKEINKDVTYKVIDVYSEENEYRTKITVVELLNSSNLKYYHNDNLSLVSEDGKEYNFAYSECFSNYRRNEKGNFIATLDFDDQETFIPIGTILHPYMDRDIITFLPDDIESLEYSITFGDFMFFMENEMGNAQVKDHSYNETYKICSNGNITISFIAKATSKTFSKDFKCSKEDTLKLYTDLYDVLINPYSYKDNYCDDTSRGMDIFLKDRSIYHLSSPYTLNNSDINTNRIIFNYLSNNKDIGDFCEESRKKLFADYD